MKRPDNAVQFRGYRPDPGLLRRARRRRAFPFHLVVFGLIGGGLLGMTILHWKDDDAFFPARAAAAPLCIANVHDGDTIRTCEGERIRIENIDAPEMPGSPKCTDRRRRGWCDYELAARSRDALAAFLARGPVAVSRSGSDKYGRTLATLSVNGRDAGGYLVSLGLARWWY